MEYQYGSWFLIKYVPDLMRREPRNVGVAVRTPQGWLTRFTGVSPDGHVAGRLPRMISRESYSEWVRYFQRKATAGAWDEVLAHQPRRAVNFYAEFGGVQSYHAEDPEVFTDSLFDTLVRAGSPPGRHRGAASGSGGGGAAR